MLVQGSVNALGSATSNPVGGTPSQLFGKLAEAVVAELHGKWYEAAYASRTFHGATPVTGATLTTQSTTTIAFGLYNPLGTTVNAEVISCDLGFLSTTLV